MNTPAENRKRVATGANAPSDSRDESWAKMIRNGQDQLFAEAHGLTAKMGQRDEPRHMAKKKEL